MPLHSKIKPSLPSLISAYFNQDESLRSYYDYSSDLKGLVSASKNRHSKSTNRKVLIEVLEEQASASPFATDKTHSQISRLASEDTCTITTGHQLCIYGGPMFFMYKIISAIKLCELVEKEGVKAVPIYWMASEDHDFAEINHIFSGNEKIEWSVNAKGPVGRIKLDGLTEFKNQVKLHFASDPFQKKTVEAIDEIFNSSKTLGQAIRDFVYWMFADFGIVVIDADDKRLKSEFIPVMDADLRSSLAYNEITKTTSSLESIGFSGQVNPREINLFWMEDGYRERIVKVVDGFQTADGRNSWSEIDLFDQLKLNPEKFSPNVVLRPMYQEVLLPNIAYIGGPGELSYWLQFKAAFECMDVFFPALILRDMAIILNAKSIKRLEQLEINVEEFSSAKDDLFNDLIRKNGSHEYIVEEREKQVEELLKHLTDEIGAFDESLKQSADSEKHRILKRLDALRKKVLRSDRKKNEITERRLQELYDLVKPFGTPQERIHNWMSFMTLESKESFISDLKNNFNPLLSDIKVFEN